MINLDRASIDTHIVMRAGCVCCVRAKVYTRAREYLFSMCIVIDINDQSRTTAVASL